MAELAAQPGGKAGESSGQMTAATRVAAAAHAVQTAGPDPAIARASLAKAIADRHIPHAGPELFLALDVDGTILHHDTSLSPRVDAALAAHRKAGSHIVLASGRGIYGTQLAAEVCSMASGPMVCSNGAITIELGAGTEHLPDGAGLPYRVRAVHTFDPSDAIIALHEAMPEAIIAVEQVGQVRMVTQLFPPGELAGPCAVVPLEQMLVPDATRVTLRGVDMPVEQMRAKVEALGMHGVEYAIGWSAWLDLSPEGVTKAAALEDVRREAGVPRGACVAVGDGANDIDMITWAGLGIAMGGSPQKVKDAADAVAASVDDDGLADLLELLL